MIVVVSGGRNFTDYGHVQSVLDAIHRGALAIKVIRNGGMTGADALSSFWAYERQVNTECYGALWGVEGRAAGPRRTRRMLIGAGNGPPADLLVAFPGGRGTDAAVKIAHELNISVFDQRGDKD